MPKPVTPFVGCDVFVLNQQKKVLLVKRSDTNLWALPGGGHDLGETPAKCAIRECFEETGYDIEIIRLLGVFSSNCYEYVYNPWKDNEYCHILFEGRVIGGYKRTSDETLEVGWFSQDEIPPLFDGHESRIRFGFGASTSEKFSPYFE